ncbi:unnamed protein product [Lota lota]
MKICVNLMPALALSMDPLDPEEESRDYSHRFFLKEEKRTTNENQFHLPEVSLASLRVLLHRVTDRVARKSSLRRGDVGVHWAGPRSGGVPESDRLSIDRIVLQRLRGSMAEKERQGGAKKGRVFLSEGDRSQRRLRPRVLPPICPGNRPPVLLTMSTGNPLLPPVPHPQRRPPAMQTQEETPVLKRYIF